MTRPPNDVFRSRLPGDYYERFMRDLELLKARAKRILGEAPKDKKA